MRERRELSASVYGLDNEIIAKLFALDALRLERFFRTFEQRYGQRPTNYAREVWPSWKTRRVGISGLNAQRFIALAPAVFSFDDRYELVAKLYEKTKKCEFHSVTVVLGLHEGGINDLENLFQRLCAKPLEHSLPESVARFATWIADNDAVIAGKLIAAIQTEQSLAIVHAARVECNRLISCIRNPAMNLTGSHKIVLPFGTITVHVRKPSFAEKCRKFFS